MTSYLSTIITNALGKTHTAPLQPVLPETPVMVQPSVLTPVGIAGEAITRHGHRPNEIQDEHGDFMELSSQPVKGADKRKVPPGHGINNDSAGNPAGQNRAFSRDDSSPGVQETPGPLTANEAITTPGLYTNKPTPPGQTTSTSATLHVSFRENSMPASLPARPPVNDTTEHVEANPGHLAVYPVAVTYAAEPKGLTSTEDPSRGLGTIPSPDKDGRHPLASTPGSTGTEEDPIRDILPHSMEVVSPSPNSIRFHPERTEMNSSHERPGTTPKASDVPDLLPVVPAPAGATTQSQPIPKLVIGTLTVEVTEPLPEKAPSPIITERIILRGEPVSSPGWDNSSGIKVKFGLGQL